MLDYSQLRNDRRKFLALSGLTLAQFQLLLPAFRRAYEALFSAEQTLAGRPRRRLPGGGRSGVLHSAEQKLLFILVYLKTYPLQVLLGEVFGLSQQGANFWIHRLLPVLRSALDELGALPERDPDAFGSQPPAGKAAPLIIDGTERRRQRPKNPEKQAAHYSGKKKTHTDKNVVVVDAQSKRVGYLSQTYAGKTHDKRIADEEGISYPRRTVLYKDSGFQGYEPAVQEARQAKKKAARGRTHCFGKGGGP